MKARNFSEKLLFNLYITQKKSTIQIAEILGTTSGVISRYMKKYGIEARYKTKKIFICMDCTNIICREAAINGGGRCVYHSHKGKLHPNFKGIKYSHGYKYIYSPNHQYKNITNYVAEHRLVMEKKLGRYLRKNEIVHHLNGIRDDNRPENLDSLKRPNHSKWTYVKQLQKQIRELEKYDSRKIRII